MRNMFWRTRLLLVVFFPLICLHSSFYLIYDEGTGKPKAKSWPSMSRIWYCICVCNILPNMWYDTPSWKTMSFFILQFTLFDALCNGMSLGHKNARSLKRYGGHKMDWKINYEIKKKFLLAKIQCKVEF